MIDRYTREEMGNIWESKNRLAKWLKIELLVCEALAKMGIIPEDAFQEIIGKAEFDMDRMQEIEKKVKHDVVAFVETLSERIGENSRYIHLGLTSSDILDTSLALFLAEASDILLKDIDELMDTIKEKAYKYKYVPMIGRTHGVHAEPITFGLKMALWYDEMKRNRERMIRARDMISYGKISGAVGTFAHIPPFVEQYVCERLGLKPAPISSQIIQRDCHAHYFTTLAIIGSSVEKFATEIRHLHRTEVREVEEFFSEGQKGSSAMPHKRNPILSENLSGLARLLRSYAMASLENINLWHERDISHSSVERIIAPDSTIILDFMLNRTKEIIENMVVSPENMEKNLHLNKGLVFSQGIMLQLILKGLSREEAYSIVQRNAMEVWEKGTDFLEEITKDKAVMKFINKDELKEAFDLKPHLAHVDLIFERVFEGGKNDVNATNSF